MIAILRYRSITFVAFDYAAQEAAACKESPFESLDKTANSDNKMKVFFCQPPISQYMGLAMSKA